MRVAKHGNRSISSKCGSADVVEALGVNIQLSPERAAQCLREVGICFLYAPNLHPAMKQVQGVRRELRMRTMFNLLGPLTNPARATGQVVGVYSLDLVEKLAEALSMLGLRRALVVHGLDGLDEITITGTTRIAEARDGSVRSYEVEPEEFGMKRATLQEIAGGDAAENAAIIRAVLGGEKSARRDVVVLNSAAALVAAGRADHIARGSPARGQVDRLGRSCSQAGGLVRFSSQFIGTRHAPRRHEGPLCRRMISSTPTSTFSMYCAISTFHPSSFFIRSRSWPDASGSPCTRYVVAG